MYEVEKSYYVMAAALALEGDDLSKELFELQTMYAKKKGYMMAVR